MVEHAGNGPKTSNRSWNMELFTVLKLLGADWNHGILNDFPETVGNGKSSQLTFAPSFFRGVGQPPTRTSWRSLGIFGKAMEKLN
jgi:hypothetical protein